MLEKDTINNKIKSILDAIKDEDTLDLSQEVSDPELLKDYSNFIDEVEETSFAIDSQLGHWTIKELIGKGGMSVVYLAERNDDQLQQQVALKVMQQGFTSQSLIDRFMREQQILSDLNHHNIAKLYDVGVTDQGVPWFVMELIQGQNILDFAKTQGLNLEQKVILFKQVCEALSYAHSQGIVHRDIKPGNLMVTEDNVVKLLDFGIASDDEQRSLTLTGAIMGTPGYMSPEQAKGLNDKIDRRSDIFSAGVLLYKIIKGEMPFVAESISEISYKIIHDEPTLIGNGIPADMQAIIFKCLEKHVDNRYASFKSLLNDLSAYLNGDVVKAHRITLLGRSVKKIKKNPFLSLVLLLALLATFSGIAYGIYQSIASVKKVQLTKEYMTAVEQIKNKIRRTHMMPLHNVQAEYDSYEREIENLRLAMSKDKIDDSGLSEFALGTAYFDMRSDEKAWDYFKNAETKGFVSSELYSRLGQLNAKAWSEKQFEAKSIENQQDREKFIQQAKVNYLQPAKGYLSKAQVDQSEAYYLKAYVAFIEEDYQSSIKFSEQEMIKNPWHYEALELAASAYSSMALEQGKMNGQDSTVDLIKSSNKMLERAIAIGGSDPRNYIKRCAYVGRDIQNQKFFNYRLINALYAKGLGYCNDAILLDPNAINPWIALHNLHKTKAEYQETLDSKSLNEYNNSISQLSLDYYRKSLNALEQGLLIEPNNFELLLLQVKPLYQIAYHTYLNGDDPMNYYDKAFQIIHKAQKINLQSLKPWLAQAYIYSEITYYYRAIIKDLIKAEEYALKAIDSAIKANEIDSNYSRIIRINAYRYSLANVKYEQGHVLEATNILRLSITERFEVIPRRSAFFKNFNDIMRAQGVLIGLLLEINQSIEEDVEYGKNLINLVCTFDGLLEKQKQQIETLIKEYVDNNWLKKDNFTNCHK
jgi:hypothetical protein